MTSLSTLLSLPFARQVLAFEAVPLESLRAVYPGLLPGENQQRLNAQKGDGSAAYVRWALDSLERLLTLPHEEELEEALMHLAIHAGEPPASLCALEIQDALRRLCRQLRLIPPTGREAVRLCLLGVLADMASGVIPADRERAALGCMHSLLNGGEEGYHGHDGDKGGCGPAFERLDAYYWQLDELDDLSALGLAQGLPSHGELMRAFHEYACRLAASLAVECVPTEGGLRRVRVSPVPTAAIRA